MTSVDQLLARARLRRDPAVPDDTVAHEDYADLAYADLAADPTAPLAAEPTADEGAARHLRTLCEAVVTLVDVTTLEFLTDQLPEPSGAWLLGCVLNLADVEESRFWWQYAAGAGHTAASYCLSLHHLARGESHAAAFWYDQTGLDAPTDSESFTVTGVGPALNTFRFDASVPTVLRVLSRLLPEGRRRRTPRAATITDYVARAVTHGYARHPTVEIPVPEPHFADRVTLILATTGGPGSTDMAAGSTDMTPGSTDITTTATGTSKARGRGTFHPALPTRLPHTLPAFAPFCNRSSSHR
ncbi:hypothetical protein [Streptomyces justiciae]|uniref:hypothetical protein n=1 Tax=Streptomyces justiciae TaxID=2780140 RepID=UPI00187EC443|nr:hypothetical protein [Streptomyces justiciae]MBE8473818.1 hypothetical protein [Streptomyces justiciae]